MRQPWHSAALWQHGLHSSTEKILIDGRIREAFAEVLLRNPRRLTVLAIAGEALLSWTYVLRVPRGRAAAQAEDRRRLSPGRRQSGSPDALVDADPEGVPVAELEAVCRMGRSWVYYRLRAHAKARRAIQVRRGYWRAVRPSDSPDGDGQ